jgi:hypothetical protein
MSREGRGRRLALSAVAGLVVLGFLLRRTGILPEQGSPFDPADYQDVPVLQATDAATVIGERAVICGTVANAVYASGIGGRPTFLNLDGVHPEQPFDIVIWGRDRGRFQPPPEVRYAGRRLCVAGPVTSHQGVPRIEARSPEQIRVE